MDCISDTGCRYTPPVIYVCGIKESMKTASPGWRCTRFRRKTVKAPGSPGNSASIRVIALYSGTFEGSASTGRS